MGISIRFPYLNENFENRTILNSQRAKAGHSALLFCFHISVTNWMGRKDFVAHLSANPLIALYLILLWGKELHISFSNPTFHHLIKLMGFFLEIGFLPFFKEHLLIMGWSLQGVSSGSASTRKEEAITLHLFKRNLRFLRVSPVNLWCVYLPIS